MLRMHLLRRLALLAVIAMLATACGDGGEETEPTEDTTETEDGGGESAEGDGQLKLGYVLPETGPLAFLGPPM
ncbi:MAG TPA: hypothetical protein VNU01_05405, partial [Egibacteraceae bacterium]|nr:hypothetical protein [Egibacteraceae bacterium]